MEMFDADLAQRIYGGCDMFLDAPAPLSRADSDR